MAEIVLKIDAGSGYEDGDVLCAFNHNRIRCVHAQHVCHTWKAPLNDDGLIVTGHVSQDYFERTHQYRFERIGHNAVRRTIIATGEVAEFGGHIASPEGGFIDVEEFVLRRYMSRSFDGRTKRPMFGLIDFVIWYGGQIDLSVKSVNQVWEVIHAKTPLRDTDSEFQVWPAGEQDLKSHLFIPVEDFTDADAEQHVRSVLDAGGNQTKKRAVRAVDWRLLATRLGVPESDVRDRNISVDKRRYSPPFADATLLFDKVDRLDKPVASRTSSVNEFIKA